MSATVLVAPDRQAQLYGSARQVFPDRDQAVRFIRGNVKCGGCTGQITGMEVDGVAVDATGLLISPGESPASVFIPANWGRRWRQAKGEAGSRLVRAHFWGDSITVGNGVSSDLTEMREQGYAGLTIRALRAALGDGGSGWIPHSLATKTGTWTARMGMGGSCARATATATIQFSVRGTTVRIYYRNANITGSFRWRIDGGGFTTVTPPTDFAQDPGTVSVPGLSDTTHTVDIEWVSGNVDIFGVEGVRTVGLLPARLCQSGRAASDFTLGVTQFITINTTNGSASVAATGAGTFTSTMTGRFLSGPGIPADTLITGAPSATSASLSAACTATASNVVVSVSSNPPSSVVVPSMTTDPFLALALGRCDLLVVALGVNDPAATLNDAGTFRNGLNAIVKAYMQGSTYDYSPDVVFMLCHQANWFDQEQEYNSVASHIKATAESIDAAVVDVWGTGRRSFKYWNDKGYFADNIHPSIAGHVANAAPLIDLLLS